MKRDGVTPDLFATPEALRDAGMARVLEGELAWQAAYLRILPSIFAPGDEITAEDIKHRMRARGLYEPHHPNCWSAE